MKCRVLSSIVGAGALYLSGIAVEFSFAQEVAPPRSEAPAAGAKAPPVVKITGQYGDQITVALLSLLSYSYYLTGEFEFSRQYAEQTIAQYKSLKNPLQNEGLEEHVEAAQAILSLIEQWRTKPIVCEPEELRIVVESGRPQNRALRRRLYVSSFRSVPLTARTDNALIGARVGDNLWTAEGSKLQTDKEVIILIAPEALKRSAEVMVVISSPEFPNFQIRVPVHIVVKD